MEKLSEPIEYVYYSDDLNLFYCAYIQSLYFQTVYHPGATFYYVGVL